MSFPAPATTTEPVRVMLCDDSAVQRGIMARILESDPGIRIVHRAGDGQAALSALAVTRPQVVLLDLEMPVMDGLEFLKQCRAEHGPAQPIVVLCTT
ncbi:MAG: response regulator, partial [Alphaproteobacteria bacterium]